MTYPIVGIIAVTTPGAAICAEQFVEAASKNGLGAAHPEYIMHARPTQDYINAVNNQDWQKVSELVIDSVTRLYQIGARLFIMPSNTPHYGWDFIEKKINELNQNLPEPIKFLNIISVSIDECIRSNYKSVLLLGTLQTMEGDLYKKQLKRNDIQYYVPSQQDIYFLDHYIKNQLVKNEIDEQKNYRLITIINSIYSENPFDAIILGCTELSMILKGNHFAINNNAKLQIPYVDTTFVLAESAIKTIVKSKLLLSEKILN